MTAGFKFLLPANYFRGSAFNQFIFRAFPPDSA